MSRAKRGDAIVLLVAPTDPFKRSPSFRMTKLDIVQAFIAQLSSELESMTAAARHAFETATNSEHQARSKYDTFSLESSYLARGQAKRVEALSEAVQQLRTLPVKACDSSALIALGSLVRLKGRGGDERILLFANCAGGEELCVEGGDVMIVTPAAPLGQAIRGKRAGDLVQVRMGAELQSFTVASVE